MPSSTRLEKAVATPPTTPAALSRPKSRVVTRLPGRPGDDDRREIGRPQPPGRRAVEIGADHGAEKQQRHRHADREFGQPIAGLGLR